MSASLDEMLNRSAERHSHLCPRQVLGVRMGLAGLERLGLRAPLSKPTGLVVVETDGCFVDGIEVATGATVGHRTLRVQDLGKIAACFVDVASGRSIRLAPRVDARARAGQFAPSADSRYAAQLEAYRAMPAEELFTIEEISLQPPLEELLSRPEARVTCADCGEEIINEREVMVGDRLVCRSCAGERYYYTVNPELEQMGATATAVRNIQWRTA